ncbi:hypothetical protein BGX28_003902 [Mortierella sp. GBA30]|nr:hypothetical protein BGX28_003902 [Mortierella sp. GBA30]
MHLEQFRLSQEAARCFDDDLDFCPTLTAKELSEIILASILAQKETQAKQLQHQRQSPPATSPSSPSTNPGSRAITIVDPASRTPLYIPPSTTAKSSSHGPARVSGRYSGSTTPATAGLMAPQSESYFNIMPSMSRQQQQQQQLFNSMYGSHAMQQHAYSMGMTSPTIGSYSPPRMASRIPIVNPDNGSIVSVPEVTPTASPAWYQNHFVAVR